MSQESVKTHTDTYAGGNPPKHDRSHQGLPTKHKERGQRPNMQERYESGCMPVNACRPFFIRQFVAHFGFF